MKFTDASAAALKLPHGKTDAIVFDDRRPGLGVRVRLMASKVVSRTWVVQLRVAGRTQRHDLGPVTATPPKRARELADDIFGKVRQGVDPKAEKRAARGNAAETFGRLSATFLKAAEARLRPRSYAGVEYHIEKQLSPLDHDPVNAIDRKRVAEVLTRIADEHGAVSANRARATLSAFFTWAIGEGFADANPVNGTTKREEKSRDRVLPGAELAAVWSACGDDDYGRIVRLLLLTGQRRDEVGAIAESELQRDRRMWSLPAERAKNGRAHDVPLSDAALALLPEAREDRGLLFGRGSGPFSGWSRCKERLDARIAEASPKGKGLAPWVLHDLRRSFATGLSELGIAPHVIEALLNHVSSSASGKAGVAGIYNRGTYAAEKREAIEKWAAHVAALVAGRVSKVVALPTKAGGTK
jgi:integrase